LVDEPVVVDLVGPLVEVPTGRVAEPARGDDHETPGRALGAEPGVRLVIGRAAAVAVQVHDQRKPFGRTTFDGSRDQILTLVAVDGDARRAVVGERLAIRSAAVARLRGR
jgi:hypothetical protein